MNVLDLFSGIGGFSLGLERTGYYKTIAFCEIGEFQRNILTKHWPTVFKYEDIRQIHKLNCDVICGGFPCQPFSNASHGVITAIDMWPEMFRVIKNCMPKIIIAENVSFGAIDTAATQMRGLWYNVTIKNISANDCGAPHARSRWWAIAHTYNESKFQRALNAEVARLPQLCYGIWGAEAYARAIRISNGISRKLDEPRRIALGNAVLPQIPEAIGRAITEMGWQ